MRDEDEPQDDECDDDGDTDQEFQEFREWLDAKLPDASTVSPPVVADKSPECATCGFADCTCISINIKQV